MIRIEHLVIHHSASPRNTTVDQIREWHKARGWKDVGYHYVVEGDGEIKIGRPLPDTGAHVRSRNRNAIGICVVGNNTDSFQRWLPLQIAVLLDLIKAVRLLWPDIKICGHRDLASTQCPGLDVAGLM